ncbi:MAG TPA: sigma-70 family RNA polymerase sigma factor [Usitatibacteraceae bacterium]|nr:sigma-70 family RNA polymerase sigma factor [Usitatibacteraceae bacterium]
MLRYQSGDAAAFDELYARHRAGLYRFIARQCRVSERIDEIFQDVWMNMIAATPRYSVQAQFRTWLFTIAHNKLMDYFRGNAKAEARLYEVKDGEESVDMALPGPRTDEPEVQVASTRARAAILAALDGLPAPQREAFLLSEEGGLTVAEIAAATGISHEAAKSRLRYAIAKLRERLEDFR